MKGAYGWNEAVRSEHEGHRSFVADKKKAEELRKLGFGSVLSINKDGIFRGSAPLVLLGDDKENDLMILSYAAANLSFNKGSSTQDYPGSLMGAIALIRQSYYDAKWYQDGGYKKEYNISLDAINRLQSLPQIFEAGDKQNELRAVAIAKEFGLNYILKGSGEEYERINELKATQSSFIIPLNFPEAFDLSDPYDALNLNLHEMKQWELAPYNAAKLEEQGINFALTLSDLKNKSDFWKNLRKAIAAGLSEEMALKALTYTPAQLLRSEGQIGSLKSGMIANFIITSGDVFDKENIILENWVNGKSNKITDWDPIDLRGNYTLKISEANSFRLKISGSQASPEYVLYQDTVQVKVSGSKTGSILSLSFELKKAEPNGLYRLSGTINQAKPVALSGDVLLPDGKWTTWTAQFDSAYIEIAKADSSSKDSVMNGPLLFPNMAFGWTDVTPFRNCTHKKCNNLDE